MDAFTFLMAIVMIMLAMQIGESWIVFGIVALIIFISKSFLVTGLLLVTMVVLYLVQGGDYGAMLPVAVFALVLLGLMLGLKSQPEQPEMYSPDMGGLEGLMGGGMGG